MTDSTEADIEQVLSDLERASVYLFPDRPPNDSCVAAAKLITKLRADRGALVDALECAREYIEPDTDWARADRVLKKINDVLALLKAPAIIATDREVQS